MKNKGIGDAALVAIVAIIVCGVLAGLYITKGGDFGSILGGEEGIAWSDVSSLDMNVVAENETGGVISEGTIKVKGIGTSQTKSRVEVTRPNKPEEEYKMIVNEETEKAWGYLLGRWSSVNYESFQANMENIISMVENNFSGWSEGENITIQDEYGTTTQLYNINVNAEIDDSLFEVPIENQLGGGTVENQLENIENQLGGGKKATVDIAQSDDADILDPARTVYPMANRVNTLIYEPLLFRGEDGELTGLLAKDWHYNESGKYYEFELREGITFHNGEPFTAEAVEYTIKRIKNIQGSQHEESVRKITDVVIVDNYTVRVFLDEEDRYILPWFSKVSSSIVSPEASTKADGSYDTDFGTVQSPPVGTGPFEFVKWLPGDRIVLKRNEDYSHGPEFYQNKGPAHIENIAFHVIGETATQETLFEQGELDYLTSVRRNENLLEKWEKRNDIKLIKQGGTSLVYLGFNCYGTENHGYGTEPVKESVPRPVRKAVAYAINENQLIDLALGGVPTRAKSWLASGIWTSTGYQEDMYPYNPSKARQILENEGYKNFKLEIMTTSDPRYIDVCSVLDSQLENVGLNAEIQQLSFISLESRVKNKNYNAFIMGYTWTLADMIWWEWHTVRLPSPNRFWWGDSYTDDIIEKTFSAGDEVAKQALKKSQRLIAEDAASLALYERSLLMARKNYVKNLKIPIGGPTQWKFLDAYLVD